MNIQESSSAEGHRVLTAEGELDVVTVEPWKAQVPELVEGASGLVLDLTAVTFFDSAAVHLVDLLLREGAARGVAVRVVAPRGRIPHRVLQIVGMLSCVDEDLETALRKV